MRAVYIVLIILLSSLLFAGEYEQLQHAVPPPVLSGETVHLVLDNLDHNQIIYNPTLFFRDQGEADYHSMSMYREGYRYFVDLPTKNFSPGNVEYYFAYQTADGEAFYYPQSGPSANPFILRILPGEDIPLGQQPEEKVEILLLSPEPNEFMEPDEFYTAISVLVDEAKIDNYKYKMLIDGVEVTRLLQQEGNLFSFAPSTIRSGRHNAEFYVYDANGKLAAKKEWSFRIRSGSSKSSAFKSQTKIFIDNRYQTLADVSRNIFRGGINFSGNYKKLDFLARVLVSSEEKTDRQPVNLYMGQVRYNFSTSFFVYLRGGDISDYYDPLVFWGKRVRGFGAGIHFKYFGLDYLIGNSARAIEGIVEEAPNPGDPPIIRRYGTYGKKFLGLRTIFNFGRHVQWNLNLINGKDDRNSIMYGTNPKESLAMGTNLVMNFDNKRIYVKGSINASMKNENSNGSIDFDSLAQRLNLSESEKQQAERLFGFLESTNFLSVTPGLVPLPSIAMQFETGLRYFGHYLRVSYKKIEADYTTAGNPYLLRDVSGLYINDNIRLLNNQIFLNLFFKSYQDNISQGEASTSNLDFGGSISYFPFSDLPSLTLSYNNISRENDLASKGIDPDSTYLLLQDIQTQRFGISSSYQFKLGAVENTASINIMAHKRNDAIYSRSSSDFMVYTIGLRNRYSIPLATRLSFSVSSTAFGEDSLQTTSDIKKLYFYIDYNLRNMFAGADLRPFANINYQNVDNSYSGIGAYNRINYSGGFYLRSKKMGNLSFRYDYIDYGNQVAWNDIIVSTRYEITF